MRPWL